MKDEGRPLRLDCAREIMNRTLGRPRVATEPLSDDESESEGSVQIFIPDNGRNKTGA